MKKHTLIARIGTLVLVALGFARQFGVYEAEAWLQGVYGIGFMVALVWTVLGMADKFFPKGHRWPETPYYVKGLGAKIWWPIMYFGEAIVATTIASFFSGFFWFLWSWEPYPIFRPFIWYRKVCG